MSVSTFTTTPEIAIIGGGIGGLATAAFLAADGVRSTVYEQAPALTAVGAGLVVAPNAARLLRRLGVLNRFRENAVKLSVAWEFRRWEDGTVLSAEDVDKNCEALYGEHTYTAHRADLLDALLSAVPEESLRLGRKCTSVEVTDDTITVTFDDGYVIHPEVVIGADGVHSVVRNAVTTPSSPAYSGLCAFRSLVAAEAAPDFALRTAQTLWIGPDHHLVHYPISGGRYVNLVAFAPAGDYSVESWTATATIDEFLGEFEGWDERLRQLIRASDVPGRWALLDRAPLEQWSRGTVTLLGDAAHAMFPFFAQGAAQALEDAATLARCLAEDLTNPERALRRYERARLPRTADVQNASRGRAEINHLPDGEAQHQRDASFAAHDPLVMNGWIYAYDHLEALTSFPLAPQ